MSENNADYLLLMFDRPNEPIYMPKGENKVMFEIPPEYLVSEPDDFLYFFKISLFNNYSQSLNLQIEKYRPIAQKIFNRFGEESNSTVPVKQISIPNLSVPLKVGRSESFSLFLPKHQKSSDALIEIFMGTYTHQCTFFQAHSYDYNF